MTHLRSSSLTGIPPASGRLLAPARTPHQTDDTKEKTHIMTRRAQHIQAALILILLLIFAGIAPSSSSAATIYGNISEVGLTPARTNILFAPLSTPLKSGSSIIISRPLTITTSTDGGFTNSLFAGDYRVAIGGIQRDSFIIAVPTNDATYNWTVLITNSLTYTSRLAPAYLASSLLATRGDLITSSGSEPVSLPVGSDGQILIADSSAPAGLVWTNVSLSGGSGTVTSVAMTSGTPHIIISGSPITSSGTIGITAPGLLPNLSGEATNLHLWSSAYLHMSPVEPGDNYRAVFQGDADSELIPSTLTWANLSSALNRAALALTNAAEFQPASENLTNWSAVATNILHEITNGLAGTNLIYRILPGDNVTAETNGWDVTLHSISSATNFEHITITNALHIPSFLSLTSNRLSLYNLLIDASNHERGGMWWETNAFKLGVQHAGSGAVRPMVLTHSNSIICYTRTHLDGPTYGAGLFFNPITYDSYEPTGFTMALVRQIASGQFKAGILFLTGTSARGGITGSGYGNGMEFWALKSGSLGMTLVLSADYMHFMSKASLVWSNTIGTLELRAATSPNDNYNYFHRLSFGNQSTTNACIWTGPNTNAFHITTGFSTNSIVGFDPVNEKWSFKATVDNTVSAGSSTNAMSGRIKVSSGTSVYNLTNSFVTADSVVLATINSADSKAYAVQAVPSAGLIQFRFATAPAVDCHVSWFIVKP